MSARKTSASSLLLVNPLQPQWLDARGQPAEPPAAGASVRVLADVVEETHVQLDVPALMGSDRQGYIQTRLQALLPDVPLRALWERAAAQPLLPRPFRLHAVGLSSPLLADELQALAQAGHSVEGVWPLSYLLAQWAGGQAALRAQASILLCLPLPHGMRMLLLASGVPVFSRLLLEHGARQQAHEVGLTLKYLADNRITERAQPPQVVPLQAGPELLQALRELDLQAPAAAAGLAAHDVLGEVLALAGMRARGQLADAELRRGHLAARMRRSLQLGTGVLLLAGLALLGLQARALVQSRQDSLQERQQAAQMQSEAAALREQLAQRQVNVPLLRLAMQVQQQELQAAIDPAQALWLLGGLLQAQPQAQLTSVALQLRAQPCSAADPAPDAGATTGAANTAPQPEWRFDIHADPALQPRQRQALLQALAGAVGRWQDWQVVLDPVRGENTSAMAGGQNAGADAGATGWSWCLQPRAPEPPGATAPAAAAVEGRP